MRPAPRRDLAVLLALAALFLLVRGAVFPYAENFHGDAVVRAELAERWANEPKVLRSFQDVYQFGPLHTYAAGLLLKLWPSREHATRLLSLLMGVLLVVPLYRLGRRVFSRQAAVVAGLAAAAWSLHIQASTTAASEALALTLFFFALDYLFQGIEEGRFGPLALSALFLNLTCATRYDAWLYIPLFAAAVALGGQDRIASVTRSVLFAPLGLVFPMWWMQQNEKAMGDPLYPIHFVDRYHAQWVSDGVGWMGEWPFRLHNLLFWPGVLLATCSLLVGVFAVLGLIRAARSWSEPARRSRWLLAMLALLPSAYFAFRGAVLLDFSPLARFAMIQLAVALLFVSDGFDWSLGSRPKAVRMAAASLAALLAVGTPAWLVWTTAWKSGKRADSLRPVSPLSTLPVEQMATARYLKASMGPGDWAVIDEDPRYVDVNVAFFSGLPEERMARVRWENFEKQLGLAAGKLWLFAQAEGTLAKKERLQVGGESLVWRGRTFEQVFSGSPALFVYRER